MAPSNPKIELSCVSLSDKRGLSASYIGSQGLIPEFYDVLKSVRRLDE